MRTLFLLCAAGAAFAQQGSIEGRVINAVTGEPVKKAFVALAGSENTRATTDNDGKFAFRNVPAGDAMLWVVQPPEMLGGEQVSVKVAAGPTPSRIEVKLTPRPSVTGRIVDEAGRPIPGCRAEIHYAEAGPWNSVPVDPDGRFELRNLNPGRFFIRANCPIWEPAAHGLVKRGELWRAPQDYYEDGFAPDGAPTATVTAAAGTTAGPFEIRLKRRTGYFLRGRITGGTPNISVTASRAGEARAFRGSRTSAAFQPGGIFRIGPIEPGAYTVSAETNAPVTLWGRAAVTMSDAAAEVQIEMQPVLPVRITVDAAGDAASLDVLVKRLDPPPGSNLQRAERSADGSYEIKLAPGAWLFEIHGLPPTDYLDSARIGPQAFDPRNVPVAHGTPEIHLSARGRKAEVEVRTGGAAGYVVAADSSNVMTTAPVSGGTARLFLPPGDYRIAAIANDGRARLPPDLLSTKGRAISVHAAERRQITLEPVTPDE